MRNIGSIYIYIYMYIYISVIFNIHGLAVWSPIFKTSAAQVFVTVSICKECFWTAAAIPFCSHHGV